MLTPNQDFSAFVWEGFGCYLDKLGMDLKGQTNAALEQEIGKLHRNSFTTSTGGVDSVTLQNGTFVIPLGDGETILAGGGPGLDLGSGLTVLSNPGGFTIAIGRRDDISFKDYLGVGSHVTATTLLGDLLGPGGIIDSLGGNISVAGGENIVVATLDGAVLNPRLTGGQIVPIRPLLQPSAMVASGGGNLVAQGGGNIVASGGGNIVASGGGNLVAQGGGNLVAQGGGNIVASGGGNIVASGGGNIVASGGGN